MKTDNPWDDATRYYIMAPRRAGKNTVDRAAYYFECKLPKYHGRPLPSAYDFIVEEEKRMKQIDFSKPVVTHRGNVQVLQEGLTLVEVTNSYGADGVYAIDEHGKTHLWQAEDKAHYGTGVRFENKPEEPKDHLNIYRMNKNSEWRINTIGGEQLQTKEGWSHWEGKPNNIVVKVPVR